MATKQYKNVRTGRTGRVGGHDPGAVFTADPDNAEVKAWLAAGAIIPVVEQAPPPAKPKDEKPKDAVER